ncbi:MAG: bifunctional DNA-formamidopyrimidine glycosylase/DNA-(apurinic or apyrimidinic site) lyase [Candidatus Solibacter usitatus]|nr:bifunctional DNA-formamidopyrimidine glycosylase/DNA-(apurinic or apyrimidinic site) lyase [Candidatus Solibacter usitatus]
MPELPEVESVVLRLRQTAPWAKIVACGQFRSTTARGLKRALGHTVDAVDRRGKNILLRLSGGAFLRIHLKMTGGLNVIPGVNLRQSTVRAWLTLEDGRAIVLNDPRALGRISFHHAREERSLFARLGPEPFSEAFTPEHLIAAARRTAKPVKIFLMDQRAVAGLGNIYAAEALFHARIHPAAPARQLSAKKLAVLHRVIRDVLELALRSASVAYEDPGGFAEAEDFPVAVYGREGEPCPRCAARVRRIAQGGRSTYYCPKCQK